MQMVEMDETLLDLKYIHWGYLHCCPTVVNRKKVKKESWTTCWVELSGTVLRLYKVLSRPVDSPMRPLPNESNRPPQESLSTFAFFDVRCANVKILQDGKVFRRKMPKSIYSNVFRCHIFKLHLVKQGICYVLQAHSNAALLRWVTKLQESIDVSADSQISFLAEERMKVVKYLMNKQDNTSSEEIPAEQGRNSEDVNEENGDKCENNCTTGEKTKLGKLEEALLMKQQFLWQLKQQMAHFCCAKGDHRTEEYTCKTICEYFLVPGYPLTFIPAGTDITVFCQLKNRRWRCFVQQEDLSSSLNKLINACDSENKDIEKFRYQLNNLPDYPLIGSVPTSVLALSLRPNDVVPLVTCDSPANELHSDFSDNELGGSILGENSTHLKPDHNESFGSLSSSPVDSTDNDSDQDRSTPTLRHYQGGFLIRKRMRKVGLSILVGSSSSDEESEEELSGISVTNAVYKKLPVYSSPKDSTSIVRPHDPLRHSVSCGTIPYKGEFTIRSELLKSFGQQTIRLRNRTIKNDLYEAFNSTQKAPDVQPPRNERRTLKLTKSSDQGFGFWLQTYCFGKNERRTFVRHVEDEEPAYMAGLREGDVIVEVNGEPVEEMEHAHIVKEISDAQRELTLVVKFMNAARHVELAVRYKTCKTKLNALYKELEELKMEEENIVNGVSNDLVHSDSFADDGDNISLSTTSSDLSSASSSDFVIRTSRFASPFALHSIQELRCKDSSKQSAETACSATTECEMLNLFSDTFRKSVLINSESSPLHGHTRKERLTSDSLQSSDESFDHSTTTKYRQRSYKKAMKMSVKHDSEYQI